MACAGCNRRKDLQKPDVARQYSMNTSWGVIVEENAEHFVWARFIGDEGVLYSPTGDIRHYGKSEYTRFARTGEHYWVLSQDVEARPDLFEEVEEVAEVAEESGEDVENLPQDAPNLPEAVIETAPPPPGNPIVDSPEWVTFSEYMETWDIGHHLTIRGKARAGKLEIKKDDDGVWWVGNIPWTQVD